MGASLLAVARSIYYAFYYYHWYLSILALLSIEIIDSLAACRVDSIS